ncbi:FAD-binding oxidoreductase [Immundisolibacter cernigliae]|uniref:Hydroxyacid dehydrogenase n=1 Tax=Immundisolibacter cernigliae TaxID=1810504 RepID=A0A1B1YY40_9GAMM|nr:FAD-binding oxidoreductase [Immundisolibacter cernigliae]ANX05656.1 hydroxyacid dehydrogenase [Immundisolibacter cernigliae]
MNEADRAGLLARLAATPGCDWRTDADAMAPYLAEQRGLYRGAALAVALPQDTAAVSALVRACARLDLALVPQGGNTGLCGGAVAQDAARQVVVSLERLDRIRAIDPANFTLTAEAGCIVQRVREAAADENRLFPLSFGADGSARLGGALSTNAGGTNVLRYGNARELTLGLEVVLADGQVWDGLTALRKDNTGYDLKQLFIGAEGTLGIITAAVVKLFPLPRETATAWLACPSVEACVAVFGRLRDASGDAVTGCELLSRTALDFVLRHMPGARDPLDAPARWYLLVELTSSSASAGLATALEAVLEQCLNNGQISDAAVAASARQAAEFWRLREGVAEVQRHEGASIKNDVAVPVSAVPAFVAEASAAVQVACPGLRVCAFGHIGDGNLHFNLSQPVGMPVEQFLAQWDTLTGLVNAVVARHRGSISAEHGIGLLKRDALAQHEPAVAIDLMRRVKAALDPQGRLNPGKLLPPTQE